jgi:hypothetical protein
LAGKSGAVLKRILLLAVACCLAACRPPYDTTLSTKQVMTQIIDPAWDAYRFSSGFVDTPTGTKDLTPTTPEGWRAADNAAAQLVEAGNLLLLPGRAHGGDWIKASNSLSQVALKARAAVERHDSKAMFDLGGDLYQACNDCHQEYRLPLLERDQQ